MDKSGEKAVQSLIERAERLEEQGSFNDALEYWRTILEHEKDAVFLCRFGRVAMKANKFGEAHQAFLEAISLNPEFPNAYDYLGMWHAEQGNPEVAVKYFERSISIKGTAATYTLLGAVQLRLWRIEEARVSFTQALEIDPGYEEAYYNLGITLPRDQPKEAIILFRRALELDPKFAAAHSELGQALRRLNENAAAEYHLRRAIELDETDGWAYLYLGNLLWTKCDLASAEESFKKVIKLWPNNSIPYWCLAMFYEYQDQSEDAEKLYHQALSIDPDDPEANKRFGVYLKDIGQAERAKAYLERALILDPEDITLRTLLASLN